MMGGSGKRSLPMARGICINTIGKLRRLRLPLPPVVYVIASEAKQSPVPGIEIASSLRSSQ
jgi:hypothetical protein